MLCSWFPQNVSGPGALYMRPGLNFLRPVIEFGDHSSFDIPQSNSVNFISNYKYGNIFKTRVLMWSDL